MKQKCDLEQAFTINITKNILGLRFPIYSQEKIVSEDNNNNIILTWVVKHS